MLELKFKLLIVCYGKPSAHIYVLRCTSALYSLNIDNDVKRVLMVFFVEGGLHLLL